MEKLVSTIQTLSTTSENDLKQLKTILLKEESVFLKNIGALEDVLNFLDPAVHSLGFTVILSCRIMAPKIDPHKFLALCHRFFTNCAANQVKLVAIKFAQICRKYAQVAIEVNQPIKAIKPLRMALVKARPNTESLTPIHADLMQVCLIAKCYSAAVSTLEEEVFEVNNEVTGVTPRDFLLYSYYGGMIWTGLKEYKKALSFFRAAVVSPALVMSAIMAESYKKYLLLSLIVHGKTLSLPRYASSVIQRHHKTSFPQYQELANAYSTGSTDELHKVASTHAEAFAKDHNFGLVKQCIQSLYRRNIQKHTQTYLTFSLQDIATNSKIESAEVEKTLLKMIESGEIFATINQKDGMVAFQDNPEQFDTTTILNHIDQRIQTAISLGKKVRTLDETIAASPQYLQKTASVHERGARGWGGEFAEEFMEGPDRPVGGPGKFM